MHIKRISDYEYLPFLIDVILALKLIFNSYEAIGMRKRVLNKFKMRTVIRRRKITIISREIIKLLTVLKPGTVRTTL